MAYCFEWFDSSHGLILISSTVITINYWFDRESFVILYRLYPITTCQYHVNLGRLDIILP